LLSQAARKWLLSGTLACAVFGLVIKLDHAAVAVTTNTNEKGSDHALHLPDSLYGWEAYAITGDPVVKLSPAAAVRMKVGRQSAFGDVPPVMVQLDQAQNVLIHVQPFPWNQLLIDGQPVTAEQTTRQPNGTIVSLSAGTHEIGYQWSPAATWAGLKIVSNLSIVLWSLFAAAMCVAPKFSRRVRSLQCSPLHTLKPNNVSTPQ
jgi:hypothetical protein